MFDGARRVRRQLAAQAPSCELAVVYGGEERQTRAVGRLIPWLGLHREFSV